jgi:hypothetical protein
MDRSESKFRPVEMPRLHSAESLLSAARTSCEQADKFEDSDYCVDERLQAPASGDQKLKSPEAEFGHCCRAAR